MCTMCIGGGSAMSDETWTVVPASPGWWLVRRCLWSGEASVEPVAMWAWRSDGEVRPVSVGVDAMGLGRGLRPTDPRAPDVEAVTYDPGRASRAARGVTDLRERDERQRSAWT